MRGIVKWDINHLKQECCQYIDYSADQHMNAIFKSIF